MAVSADPWIGAELAGYRIEEIVGRGGMGVVYRGDDPALGRKVALKLLAPELARDERFRSRFLVETRLAASLEHPNVVPIHDAGEVEGQLYLVMRLVEGTDLKRLLAREGVLAPERALRISAQIAAALDAAHAAALVHRDVKPSNVLLDEREHAYLADFGLTRRLADQVSGFDAGLSLGTPAYVAPEQIEGQEVSGQADQYSLACLLHECLTGAPPFRRATEAATLFAHLDENPLPPPGLEAVMPRALAKSPSDRFESCSEFVAAAGDALGVAAALSSRTLHRLLAAGVAAVVLAAAGIASYFGVRGSGAAPSGDAIVRINPVTGKVAASIRLPADAAAVSVAGNDVWVASHRDSVVFRIDARTNRVELRAPAHGTPSDLAVDAGTAVVANGPLDASMAVLDRATGAADTIMSLPSLFGTPPRVASGPSGFWVAATDRRVGRLDVGLGELVHPIVIPAPHNERGDSYFSGIAVTRGAVWVVGDLLDPEVWRLDPATGRLVTSIRLPFAPKDVAAGAGGVWVANAIDRTISRVDPKTLKVVKTIALGAAPDDVASGGDGVWVTTHRT